MSRRPMHPEGLVLVNANGEQRGFVDPKGTIEDVWIMQGSLCDLKCTHCYTGSSPRANHLEQIAFDELRPHLDAAARLGVQRICFTGGEPFVNEDVLRGRALRNEEFLKSVAYALEIAPVEILTNGRKYIRNHFDALAELWVRSGGRLRIRVTLESPGAAGHDAIRGKGTFAQTVETVVLLGRLGFVPVVTAERPFVADKSDAELREAYAALFRDAGVEVEVNVIGNVMEMGHQLATLAKEGRRPGPEVFVTTGCFSVLNKPAESLMCHFSRSIQKVDGALRIYPCPVIYDDPRFELGAALEDSLQRVYIAHKNCYDYCMRGSGATCRTLPV